MGSAGRADYSWVDQSSEIAVASCFSFYDGLSVDEVVTRTGIEEWRSPDRRASADGSSWLSDGDVAVFADSGWTVLYEPNGYPQRFAERIAASPDVNRCVVVFWNVNAVTEFAYWEHGLKVVAFDWPQDRWGSEPDRLLADMRETVGLERTGEEGGSVFDIYQQMLALAERITGIHLGPDFLGSSSLVVGLFNEDDEDFGDAPSNNEFASLKSGSDEEFGSPFGVGPTPPGQYTWTQPGTGGHPEWVPEERRINEQALGSIPKDRWDELPARLARLACERVRIADQYPVDEILEDLDQGRRPSPARLTIPMDVYAMVEGVTMGARGVPVERVWAAIEAVFAASKAKSRRSPLDVLLQARVAADDHATTLIDQVRADMSEPD